MTAHFKPFELASLPLTCLFKGYAPAIAGIWGREGGVGEGLPELKFSSIILSFKTFR